MIGEIIAIGNELTSGRILNTTSSFAAGLLFTAGHDIIAMATIGDTAAEIGEALKRAIKRADFVIVTGGLGPTSDDLTNEAVAHALERPAILYPEILEKIKEQLAKAPDQAGQHLEKLAWLPEGAEVLKPEARMAGYLLVQNGKPIFFLPGVPHQMKELMAERVIPRLAVWKGASAWQVRQRVFKVFGLPETEINRKLFHLEGSGPGIRLGYYPVFPDVHLSLTVLDGNPEDAERRFQEMSEEIQTVLGDVIFGADNDTMAAVVGRLLRSCKKMLAVAESCSGGLIAHKITKEPGSSDYFSGGVVAYSNELKALFLGVDRALIAEYGAVSAQVARAMAAGILARTATDIAVAVTGIAGPGGGTAQKPVGTVFFGLATPGNTVDFQCHFSGDRWQIQEISAQTALDLVRRQLLDIPLSRCATI